MKIDQKIHNKLDAILRENTSELSLEEIVDKIGDLISHMRVELENQQEDLAFLRALEDAGVDNWEGYDFARELFNQ
jgi:hypothetical protein